VLVVFGGDVRVKKKDTDRDGRERKETNNCMKMTFVLFF